MSYPSLIPSLLFDLVDNRFSQYWISVNENKGKNLVWAFPEWASNINYLENLVDWGKIEEEIFNQYKLKMDLKFPDPSVTEKAEIGDHHWLICPKYIDAWMHPSNREAMVSCPKCLTIYNNP